MATVGCLDILNSIEENKRMPEKLSKYIVNKWNRVVDHYIYGDIGTGVPRDVSFPQFAAFVDFMKQEERLANSVLVSKEDDDKYLTSKRSRRARSFASDSQVCNYSSTDTQSNASRPKASTESNNLCVLCKGNHKLECCNRFKQMSVNDKQTFIKGHALCFGCLTYGHMKIRCKQKMKCDRCNGSHPTILHDDDYRPKRAKNIRDNNQEMPNVT